MIRCEAIKGDGEQCTRGYATVSTDGKHLCTQHSNCNAKKALQSVKQCEPWTRLALPEPDARNGKRYLQKVRKTLANTPRSPDGLLGHIYIYYLPREKPLNYWKIGYTARTVEERMSEWSSKHTLQVYTTFKVDKHDVHWVEQLIFMYLAYCRLYRYPHKQGYQSVYMLKPGDVIQDGQQCAKGDERLVAKNKQIEWFCAPIEEILAVVEPIIKKYG